MPLIVRRYNTTDKKPGMKACVSVYEREVCEIVHFIPHCVKIVDTPIYVPWR